jgi:hypothetical protein
VQIDQPPIILIDVDLGADNFFIYVRGNGHKQI